MTDHLCCATRACFVRTDYWYLPRTAPTAGMRTSIAARTNNTHQQQQVKQVVHLVQAGTAAPSSTTIRYTVKKQCHVFQRKYGRQVLNHQGPSQPPSAPKHQHLHRRASLDLQLPIALCALGNWLHASIHAVTLDTHAVLSLANTECADGICECSHGVFVAHRPWQALALHA